MEHVDGSVAQDSSIAFARSLASLEEIGDGLGGMAFADFIGLQRDGPGAVRLTVKPTLLNGGGLLLGPVGFALVDFSMASALWAQRNPGEEIATINISLNFIRSASNGVVICRSKLDRRNRHTAALSSTVHHDDGRLLMTAVGSFAIYAERTTGGESDAAASSHLPSIAL
jgi:uncharacterized protein (TIGR00369 family)